jgi:hypothetical protein
MMCSSIGRGSKIHVIVDENSKPITVDLNTGNTHDSRMFNRLYDEIECKPSGSMDIQHTIHVG